MCIQRITWTGVLALLIGMMPCHGLAVEKNASSGANLFVNPSFENSRGDRPEAWSTQTWQGAGRFEYATSGRTGNRSVAISSDQGADIGWRQDVRLRPFARYRLSGWIKTKNVRAVSGRGALLNLHTIQSVQTPALTGTHDWTQVEAVFNTDSQYSIQINCLFGGWGLATGRAWYDDLRLELLSTDVESPRKPRMFYTDDTYGRPFAKDPDVVRFKDRYLMYYSLNRGDKGIAIGIAESRDLDQWKKIGEILPQADYEKNGLAAPAALVIDQRIHLFYQTYGNNRRDAICHAVSEDGLHFTRNKTNPIFSPTGDWNCGRAIDADVIEHNGRYLLYCATRDPDMKVQMLVAAAAPLGSNFERSSWTQLSDQSILKPLLSWERNCIEAPSLCKHEGKLYMFYAGAYNNEPQQIGCAVSSDGIAWQRLSDLPLLPNGRPGDWNADESGHPGIFVDHDGRMHLFFQGNNNRGASWFLSRMNVSWDQGKPLLVRLRDDRRFTLRPLWRPTVSIDAARTTEPISKYIFGQFIEHLGRCIYGGIWAEMLEDRKFYYPITADYHPWQPITPPNDRWSGAGAPYDILVASPWQIVGPAQTVKMVKENAYVGEHTPHITPPGDGTPAGIAQNDLALQQGKTYVGRLVFSADRESLPLQVSLIWDKSDRGRNTVTINETPSSGQFVKHPLKFRSGGNTDNGRLEIVSRGKGTFQIGTVSLMPADNINGFRADTLRLMRELNSPVYRWPGGNFVSGYDWKDGLGDPDRRPPRKNPAWKGIEHNDVGIHEFMDLCRLLRTEPYIALNTGLGSVESACEEVEYCNGAVDTPMGRWRAKNGRPEPFRVKWWAVGNEMYGSWQLGNVPLEQYVLRHNKFVEAIRRIDPSVQLIAVGAVGRWSEEMLTHCADHMNLISEHFYHGNNDNLLEHVAQIPGSVKRIADAHRRYRRDISALTGKDIRIALDEWNYWYGPNLFGELGVRYVLKDALGIAAGLHEYFRNSDIMFMANYAQTVNVIGCIKTSKTAAAFASTGLVLKLYRQHFGEVPVHVAGDLDPLDVAAALGPDRKTLTIGIVNPTRRTFRVPTTIQGFSPASDHPVWVITAPDEMAYNQPGSPPQITIQPKELRGEPGFLEVPPLSVSLHALNAR